MSIKTDVQAHEAVRQNPLVLKYVPEALKTPGLCLAAVEGHGWALLYVPEPLKTEALCLTAARVSGVHVLDIVPACLLTRAVCTAAAEADGADPEAVWQDVCERRDELGSRSLESAGVRKHRILK